MRKVLITDWLEKFGGAERVVKAIAEIYKFDYYYAYIDRMPQDVKDEVFQRKVKVTQSNLLKLFGKYFRYTMPIFPLIVNEFNNATKQNKVDLIISSSWALSKGYKNKGAVHICYLQARNFKYVWSEAHLYFKGILRVLSFTKKYLRKFDINAAQNPDVLISNSKFVQDWVKVHYNRDSYLIYPPVEVDCFCLSESKEDYYITIGRLEIYKRFDIIIDAFNKNKKKLIVVGSGSELKSLMKSANDNIQFCGFLKKNEFENKLNRAKGFVYSGIEDFGISIVESLASGVPVIGYNGGAMSEIIEDGIDGYLFDKQDSISLNDAIQKFEETYQNFDPKFIKERADRFSKIRFQNEFKTLVDSITDNWHA